MDKTKPEKKTSILLVPPTPQSAWWRIWALLSMLFTWKNFLVTTMTFTIWLFLSLMAWGWSHLQLELPGWERHRGTRLGTLGHPHDLAVGRGPSGLLGSHLPHCTRYRWTGIVCLVMAHTLGSLVVSAWVCHWFLPCCSSLPLYSRLPLFLPLLTLPLLSLWTFSCSVASCSLWRLGERYCLGIAGHQLVLLPVIAFELRGRGVFETTNFAWQC